MAPSSGIPQLLARNAKLLRLVLKKTSRFVRAQLSDPATQLRPAYVSNVVRHPVNRVALHHNKSWSSSYRRFHTFVRQFAGHPEHQTAGARFNRASYPKSAVSRTVGASSGRAPFASTLRPNLTGGALPRTAGGYGLAGGARYFSHGPAAPAQVIQNVSQAVRAFVVSGQKAQYAGMDQKRGTKRYRAVTPLQKKTITKLYDLPKATPGSFLDFDINPTITALTSLQTVPGFPLVTSPQTLQTEGLLDVLSVDFSRSLKELAAVMNDLQRLATLGDLPITYEGHALRVHFPGCDADTVERLCEELGVRRGVVYQDEDFDAFVGTEIALLFPFADTAPSSECDYFDLTPVPTKLPRPPSIEWQNMLSPIPSSGHEEDEEFSTQSEHSWDDAGLSPPPASYVEMSPSGYETLRSSELDDEGSLNDHIPLEYQGFEGIYRFMEQCQPSHGR